MRNMNECNGRFWKGSLALAALAGLALGATGAMAQDGTEPASRPAGEARQGQVRERVMQRIDRDGDGVISEAERAEARDAMQRARGGDEARPDGVARPGAAATLSEVGRALMLERYDTDGDGTLSAPERESARKSLAAKADARRADIMKKYDTDKNGELNEEERAAVVAFERAEREAEREAILKKYDADADGTLNETERMAARGEVEKRRADREVAMFVRFDANGNGTMEPDERRAAGEAMREEAAAMGVDAAAVRERVRGARNAGEPGTEPRRGVRRSRD